MEAYYKNMFGSEATSNIHLRENFWANRGSLNEGEAQELVKPFTMEEIERALLDMDVNSAPGPDRLPAGFYREFWHELKFIFLEMQYDA